MLLLLLLLVLLVLVLVMQELTLPLQVTRIVNCTVSDEYLSEIEAGRPAARRRACPWSAKGVRYRGFDVGDWARLSAPPPLYFRPLFDWIDDGVRKGESVLLFAHADFHDQRAATVAVAYCMRCFLLCFLLCCMLCCMLSIQIIMIVV